MKRFIEFVCEGKKKKKGMDEVVMDQHLAYGDKRGVVWGNIGKSSGSSLKELGDDEADENTPWVHSTTGSGSLFSHWDPKKKRVVHEFQDDE